jgi:Ca2+-binding RTX toxin-like protein
MRRWIGVVLSGLVALGFTPAVGVGQVDPTAGSRADVVARQRAAARTYADLAPRKGVLTEAELVARLGPNPWLSLVPGRTAAEVAVWRELASSITRARSAPGRAAGEIRYTEREAPGTQGDNDTIETGERLRGVGSGTDAVSRARIFGTLVPAPPLPVSGTSVEDDGAIALANPAGLTPGTLKRFAGEVGDGPHAATGDFDFYALGPVAAGETIVIDIDTSQVATPTDAFVALWDESGFLIDLNDDSDGLDSKLVVTAPADGNYFAMVTGCCGLPLDPFDPASGEGPTAPGQYEVDLGVAVGAAPGDADVYLVDLEKGDTLSVGVTGGSSRVEVFDPAGVMRMGSGQNAAPFIYPDNSPLMHQGHIGADHVAAVSGRHAIKIGAGGGAYQAEVRVHRPGLSGRDDDATQILYIDFDGAVVDTTVYGGVDPSAELSPLREFLFRWGLLPGDEDAVITAIMRSVRENVARDLATSGHNGDRDITGRGGQFDVVIRNSRDHADPGDGALVTRLVVGGSIAESGIPTIGIAQSIDPGNYDRGETGLVLLDVLSERPGSGLLNDIPLAPRASMVDLVGVTVGNVTAHEAGHMLGNWHTDPFNGQNEIMDAGGNLAAIAQVGPDGIFGTADDEDVDFRPDAFTPEEGFSGVEDSRQRSAFALSTGSAPVEVACTISGTPGDDTLTGTDHNDVICGLGGDDVLAGGRGRDRIEGGGGNDRLSGADAWDLLFGGRGDDRIAGGDGPDLLVGGRGDDAVNGGPGRDRCRTGETLSNCE